MTPSDPAPEDLPADEHERRRSRLVDAAIAAEYESGQREESVEEAKRHIVLRIANVVGGVLVVIVGLAMMVLPGPGVVVTLIGLALLAPEVPFADRMLKTLRARVPEGEDGNVDKRIIVLSVVMLVVFTGGSIWWGIFRPDDFKLFGWG